mgnify:CR=1 FL=1
MGRAYNIRKNAPVTGEVLDRIYNKGANESSIAPKRAISMIRRSSAGVGIQSLTLEQESSEGLQTDTSPELCLIPQSVRR